MGDNSLVIGATVETGAFGEGMNSVSELTKQTASGMAISFTELGAKTKSAFRSIGEDVKLAAATVSAESLKVAEATKAQAAAFADLRRANILARDSNFDVALSTSLLAAAQQKAVGAATQVVAAKEMEAAAVAAATAAEVADTGMLAGAFRRLATMVGESSTQIQEHMLRTTEAANVEAEGITAGFAGLSTLLGAGLAVGFAAHFLDGVAKMNTQLSLLSEATKISIQDLSGLQLIAEEDGVTFAPVALGVQRLARAQQEARDGMTTYTRSFTELGISMKEIQNDSPEEMLARVSTAFATTGSTAARTDASVSLFGRGGLKLIPILEEQGAHLHDNMVQMGKLKGVTDESAAAARRWTRDTAQLSAEFRSDMMPVMEHAEDVVIGIRGVFEAAAAAIITVVDAAGAAVVTLATSLGGVGKLLLDASTGNYAQMVSDTESVKRIFVDQWTGAFQDIKASWKTVATDFTSGLGDKGPALLREGGDVPVYLPGGRGHHAHASAAHPARSEKEDPLLKTQHYNDKGDLDAMMQADVKAGEAAQTSARVQVQALRAVFEEQQKVSREKYEDTEKDSAYQVRVGKMTAAHRVQILKQATEQEYMERLQAQKAIEMLDKQDVLRYQQDMFREVEITKQAMRQITQLNRMAGLEVDKGWKMHFATMQQEFTKLATTMATDAGAMTLQVTQLWKQMATQVITEIVTMTVAYMTGVATQQSGQAMLKLGDAELAAANTYATISAIPIVGPFLAPPAAAVAFAAVMAFEHGGIVGGSSGMAVPIIAHAGERVLTTQQTANFERMVNSNNTSRSSSMSANVTQHFHGGKASSAKETRQAIQTLMRQGKLAY
ncbi:MAG: hypothetical protein ACYDC6_11060 [Acidobacteriaceae bacterium]